MHLQTPEYELRRPRRATTSRSEGLGAQLLHEVVDRAARRVVEILRNADLDPRDQVARRLAAVAGPFELRNVPTESSVGARFEDYRRIV